MERFPCYLGTHCSAEMCIKLPGYSAIPNPCNASKEEPRGGCHIIFVKEELRIFVTGPDVNFNDAITMYLCNGSIILGIYIPSPYIYHIIWRLWQYVLMKVRMDYYYVVI